MTLLTNDLHPRWKLDQETSSLIHDRGMILRILALPISAENIDVQTNDGFLPVGLCLGDNGRSWGIACNQERFFRVFGALRAELGNEAAAMDRIHRMTEEALEVWYSQKLQQH